MTKHTAQLILVFFISLIFHGCSDDGITASKWTDGFNAKMLSKPINGGNPLIITLHGSSGGYLPDDLLRPLVHKGYDVVNLSYFGSKGLPDRLELIPLEYVKGAIDHYKTQFPNRTIVLLGVSRGAELALLYGSNFNNINGIIAYSPTSIVLPESVHNTNPLAYKSSWIYKGEPITYAPIAPLPPGGGEVVYKSFFEPLFSDPAVLEKYTIPVGNIKCPVLLMSGQDDQVWPSAEMGARIQAILKGRRAQVTFHDIYPNVGHQFIFFGDDPVGKTSLQQTMRINGEKYIFPFRGTEQSTMTGMIRSRDRVLYFLKNFI